MNTHNTEKLCKQLKTGECNGQNYYILYHSILHNVKMCTIECNFGQICQSFHIQNIH